MPKLSPPGCANPPWQLQGKSTKSTRPDPLQPPLRHAPVPRVRPLACFSLRVRRARDTSARSSDILLVTRFLLEMPPAEGGGKSTRRMSIKARVGAEAGGGGKGADCAIYDVASSRQYRDIASKWGYCDRYNSTPHLIRHPSVLPLSRAHARHAFMALTISEKRRSVPTELTQLR